MTSLECRLSTLCTVNIDHLHRKDLEESHPESDRKTHAGLRILGQKPLVLLHNRIFPLHRMKNSRESDSFLQKV